MNFSLPSWEQSSLYHSEDSNEYKTSVMNQLLNYDGIMTRSIDDGKASIPRASNFVRPKSTSKESTTPRIGFSASQVDLQNYSSMLRTTPAFVNPNRLGHDAQKTSWAPVSQPESLNIAGVDEKSQEKSPAAEENLPEVCDSAINAVSIDHEATPKIKNDSLISSFLIVYREIKFLCQCWTGIELYVEKEGDLRIKASFLFPPPCLPSLSPF